MNKKLSSYYMYSSNMTTYNENGNINSKHKIRINNNGVKDFYNKEFIIENNKEKILLENGNEKLTQIKIPNFTSIFNYFWNNHTFFPSLDTENTDLEKSVNDIISNDSNLNNNENSTCTNDNIE